MENYVKKYMSSLCPNSTYIKRLLNLFKTWNTNRINIVFSSYISIILSGWILDQSRFFWKTDTGKVLPHELTQNTGKLSMIIGCTKLYCSDLYCTITYYTLLQNTILILSVLKYSIQYHTEHYFALLYDTIIIYYAII